jgi:Flp pilus assembly protein TadD
MTSLRNKSVSCIFGCVVVGLFATIVCADEPVIIRGVVLDSEGKPLAGATVKAVAQDIDFERSVRTKKSGRFALRVPDFKHVYDVNVDLEGYASVTTQIRPNPEDQPIVTVTLPPAGQDAAQPPSEPVVEASRAETSKPEPDLGETRMTAVQVFNEGVAAIEEEDLPTALEKFKQASELDPDYANALNAISVVAAELGEYAAAADAAERLIQLQPDSVDAMSIAYFSELKIRDLERAIPAARRLAEADPEVVTDQMVQHAEVLYGEFEYAGCRALLEIVIDHAPDFTPAYLQLGLACNALQDTGCAVQALEKFLELAPDDPEAATAQSLLDYLR